VYDGTFATVSNICSALTPYGVIVRYPNELNVDETLAKLSIDRAQQVYDFCVRLVLKPPQNNPTI
jgi:hypothetical protein